ncbi:MAG TPA: prepilin-type N-terminal cleavage/methylation domain-containing protein [Rickettsiales bacterium]|nr:prepilin-type N-terminal cleavage/methylation domain-containing protein [Rickettsiales bacterium]
MRVKAPYQAGFTLIELSIVLVIIGLIVGGILTGRDLIKAAEIRATLSQIEKYNTAAHTFQNKYGNLPGDLLSSQACSFGFFCVTGSSANTTGYGDGNGIIQGYNAAPWLDGGTYKAEIAMFFLQLSQAALIDGMYGVGADVSVSGATATGGSTTSMPKLSTTATGSMIGEVLPLAKLGNGNYITIGSINGFNYYVISGINSIDATGTIISTNNLSPLEAFAMDKKVDDGLPGTGTVFALDTVTTSINHSSGTGLTTLSANNCLTGSAYYTSGSYGNTPNCSLRINLQ